MASWDTGYGDFEMVPDLETLRLVPWLPHGAGDGRRRRATTGAKSSPRRARSCRRSTSAPHEMGYTPMSPPSSSSSSSGTATRRPGRRTSTTSRRRSPTSSTTTPRDDDGRAVHRADPPRDARGRDAGRVLEGRGLYGQHEINFRYADAVTSADRHAIYKNGAKEIAFQDGISATFMAKSSEKDIGSSCHIHSRLVDDERQERLRRRRRGDRLFRHFLGGQRACMGELALLVAPSINSYKRYAPRAGRRPRSPGAATTAPAASGSSATAQSRRVECRIPGADVNPYLALRGADRRRPPRDRERSTAGAGARGQRLRGRQAEAFPSTLREAVDLWEGSDFARKAFGDEVGDHYLNYGRTESGLRGGRHRLGALPHVRARLTT